MKLSGSQLFIVTLVSLAILSGIAYLDRSYVPVLAGIVLSVITNFIYIHGTTTGATNLAQGISIGIPLAPVATPAPSEIVHAPPAPAPEMKP